MKNQNKIYVVTGTYHGVVIDAKSEGDARRIFHKVYNGESIVEMKLLTPKHRISNL